MTDKGMKEYYLTPAEAEVIVERRRQVSQEGFTAEHDDRHTNGVIAMAAMCYTHPSAILSLQKEPPCAWPWGRKCWKPKDYHTNLVKATALLLAELERIMRIEKRAISDD